MSNYQSMSQNPIRSGASQFFGDSQAGSNPLAPREGEDALGVSSNPLAPKDPIRPSYTTDNFARSGSGFFGKKAPTPQRVNPQLKKTRNAPTDTYQKLSDKEKAEAYFETREANLRLKKSHKELEDQIKHMNTQLQKLTRSAKNERLLAESYTGLDFKSQMIDVEDDRNKLRTENQKLHEEVRSLTSMLKKGKVFSPNRGKAGPMIAKYGIRPKVMTKEMYSITKSEHPLSPPRMDTSVAAAIEPEEVRQQSGIKDRLNSEIEQLQAALNTERIKNLELEGKLKVFEIQGSSSDLLKHIQELQVQNRKLEQELQHSLSWKNPFAGESDKQLGTLREKIANMESEEVSLKARLEKLQSECEMLRRENIELNFAAKHKDSTFQEFDALMKKMGERGLNEFLRQLGLMKLDGETPAWAQLDFLERGTALPNDVPSLKREVERLKLEKGELAAELEKMQTLLTLRNEQDKEHRALQAAELEQIRMQLKVAEQRVEEQARISDFRANRVIELERNQRLNIYDSSNRIVASKSKIRVGDFEAQAPEFQETDTHVDPGENIVDLWVGEGEFYPSSLYAVMRDDVPNEPNFLSFLAVDFFNHETQTTSLCDTFRPKYDIHISFKVTVDDYFINYLSKEKIYFEVHLSRGDSQLTIGTGQIPLKELLGLTAAHMSSSVIESACNIVSSYDGRSVIGSLRYKLKMRHPLSEAMRWFQEKQEVIELSNPKQYALDVIYKDQPVMSERTLIVNIYRCIGLVSSAHPGHLRPFVFFQFFTESESISHTLIGPDPIFDLTYEFTLRMTGDLKKYLDRENLEILVLDDNAPLRQHGQDVIGIAKVPLSSLVLDAAAEGTYALFNMKGSQVGGISLKIAWKDSVTDSIGYGTPLTEAWQKDLYNRIAKALSDRSLGMESAFGVFDQDQDGLISTQEFRNTLLITLRLPISEQEVQLLLNSLRLVDGGISRTMFRQLFSGMLSYDRPPQAEENWEEAVLKKVRDRIREKNLNVWQAFEAFDSDQNGYISEPEFVRTFRIMDLGLSEIEITRLFRAFDPQRTGKISFKVFCEKVDSRFEEVVIEKVRQRIREKNLSMQQTFNAFDRDRNGVISHSEFREAFRIMDLGLTGSEIDRLITHFDSRRSGMIDFRTFCAKIEGRAADPVGGASGRPSVHIPQRDGWEAALQRLRGRIREKNLNIRQTFEAFDKDKNGMISHSEFKDTFRIMDLGLNNQDIEDLLRYFDPQRTGSINFRTFCVKVEETPDSARDRWESQVINQIKDRIREKNLNIRQAFGAFDANKNGFISHTEFREALRTMQLGLHESDIDRLLRYFDPRYSGQIDFRTFCDKLEEQVGGATEGKLEESTIERIKSRIRENRLNMRQAFEAFDENKNGLINREEFRKAFGSMELGLNDREIERVFMYFDKNRSGEINYRTFCQRFEDTPLPSERWEENIISKVKERIAQNKLDMRSSFEAFDTDKNGKISRNEFRNTFRAMNFGLTEGEIDKMMRYFDPQNTGEIDYRTFCSKLEERWEESVLNLVRQRLRENKLDMRQSFAAFDADKSGMISRQEFMRAFESMKFGIPDRDINALFRYFDHRNSGQVDFRTFCNKLEER